MAFPDNSSSISVNKSNLKKKRKRRVELGLALGAFFLIILLTGVELQFFGINSYLFLAFFNLNLILLLVVLSLVLRNGVKLILERRRNVLGAKLRSRLVLAFISLSFVPALLIFLVSIKFVQTSVDFWFKSQVENSMEQALEVGQDYYADIQKALERQGRIIIDQIRSRRFAWGGKAMDGHLRFKLSEFGLSLIGVINPEFTEQNWHASEQWQNEWQGIKDSVDWSSLKEKDAFWSALRPGSDKDLVVGVLPVDEGETGYLVLGDSVGHGLLQKLDQIVQGVEEYKQLQTLKYPLKVAFYLILGVMTLLILFGAMWFGFRLAKEISAPVQALAAGTQRISNGDLSVRLEDESADELGFLVQSFNQMAEDLEQSQNRLSFANQHLARQNLELEEHGQYMEAVLNNITSGVISLDATGQISTVNRAAEAILGIDARKIIGQKPMQLLQRHKEYAEIVGEMIRQLEQSPATHWQRQLELSLKNREIKILLNAVVLNTNQGQEAGKVVVFEDITELDRMQRMEAWKEVARRIAHEIKNPLTPIKLSAQRLERKYGNLTEDATFFHCTGLIVRQVEHLQQMVKEFSKFAKLPEVKPAYNSLWPLLEELVALFKNSHSRISWQLDNKCFLPQCKFDRESLKRAFFNILTNAAEVLENEEKPLVQVSAAFDEKTGWCRVTISDNGPGLSSEEKSRLFEPYFSRKRGGTGLGLTIVKSIISDHRGYVKIRPNDPKGSVFIVEIPAG